ncbi:unnamed protein product [Ambrosiozyma monospora]|uniref:Unnamed protein product n=1 Tax=Ambrosiozyma monospora TaxID=43982 RepID=A0ACB5TBA7_AMBMO|nr:unnamed protein product [Ambrosiozyma monospora]
MFDNLKAKARESVATKGEIAALLPDYGPWAFLRIPFLLKLNALMFVISLSSTNTGYDGSLLNGLQAMPKWMDYVSFHGKPPSGAILGNLANGCVFGVILSFPIASKLSDYLGRRNSIVIGNIFMLIGVLLQSASQNYAMFLISRIVLGFDKLLLLSTIHVGIWVLLLQLGLLLVQETLVVNGVGEFHPSVKVSGQ